MKVITAPEIYHPQYNEIAVFLAGGITNCPEWQNEVIKKLREEADKEEKCLDHLERLVVLNPRRENFPIHDPSASTKQITWEYNALESCNIFSMYFSDGVSDQPICMYELGRNICRMQMKCPSDWAKRLVITSDRGYKRFADVMVQTQLATDCKVTVHNTIDEHVQELIYIYNYLIFN